MAFSDTFRFYSPTRITLGKGAVARLPNELRNHTEDTGLVVTDRGLVEAGIVEKITRILDEFSIAYELFDEVKANPPTQNVHVACERFKSKGCSFIIGLGGGSSMDVAKLVGVLAVKGGNILDYVGVKEQVGVDIPFLVCIPTTYGTASEVTPFAVVTDEEKHTKPVVTSPHIIPKVALIDPELSVELPMDVGAATGMDALTHAVESYVNWNSNLISGALALEAIRIISANIRQAVSSDKNIEATENMLIASTMAGMAFSQTGLGNVHAMSHPLGGHFDCPHGEANSVLLPHVMEYNLIACPSRFADIASSMDVWTDGLDDMAAAELSVEAVRTLSLEVGIPDNLAQLGIEEDRIPQMAEDAMGSRNVIVNPRKTTLDDIIDLYRRAM